MALVNQVKQYAPNYPYYTIDDENILRAVKQDPISFIGRTDKSNWYNLSFMKIPIILTKYL